METQHSLESPGTESQPAVPDSHAVCVPLTLRGNESYHVFISYSSTDYQWTHSLIDHLESYGLQVCYHERDFTPGRTVLENMSECIHESQKVLLVLSQEFVRSRWCLLEANMSLFRDCLGRKPIIPVMLQPGVQVPLHLCHLTYLEADDTDFMNKLLKVLCTTNQHLQGSTVIPFQPPSIYNGKALQPLTAVNDEGLNKWDAGHFSDMEVPDQLRLVIEDQNKFREAVRIVNSVSQTKVCLRLVWVRALIYIAAVMFLLLLLSYYTYIVTGMVIDRDQLFPNHSNMYLSLISFCLFCSVLGLLIQIVLWKKDSEKYIVRELQKAIGKANIMLSAEKVLMGCQSNSKIYLVYVSLDGCKQQFGETFGDHSAGEMFQRALLYFSSGYACCLSKRHFPFTQPNYTGHLERGVCFCQYVSQQLNREEWQ